MKIFTLLVQVIPLALSFQPVLHDWYNKCCGMCYTVCWIMHIKEPLLLIGKSSYVVAAAVFLSRYLNGP